MGFPFQLDELSSETEGFFRKYGMWIIIGMIFLFLYVLFIALKGK